MCENKSREIQAAFERSGLKITDVQSDQLARYYELLVEWNERMNLTAITDFEDVVLKHYLDSASGRRVYDFSSSLSLMDLGTGAGFPGIPLKILYPQLKVTLVDSLNKRITFLNHVIQDLGLTDIAAIHGRGEDLARKPEYREQFDIVVSRAVANTSTLLEYCIPFVKVDGYFLAYKSGKFKEEVAQAPNAMRLLSAELEKVDEFLLENTDNERTLALFRKTAKTSKRFPRKAGLPAKEPLG